MSKGIGGLQRALLVAIQEHGCLDTLAAARHAFKVEPCEIVDGVPYYYDISDAQHAATRRALAGLVKRGLIVNEIEEPGRRGKGYRDGRARWCTAQHAEAKRAEDAAFRHRMAHVRIIGR